MTTKIILSSNSQKSITLYTAYLKLICKKVNNLNFSVIHLPTKTKRITLLKSPHVYKKAKEQFEIKRFKTVFFFKTNIPEIITKGLLLNKPKSITMLLKF